MPVRISGIEAAGRAAEGRGTMWVDATEVLYSEGRFCVKWSCRNQEEAKRMHALFQASIKYPAARQTKSTRYL